MRAGTARGLAWGLWALWAALAAFGLALAAAGEVSSDAAFLLLFAAFATVGALIASRRPKNTIGWLFCALALGWTIDLLFEGYTKAHPNSESALALAAWWMRSWFWFLWLGTAAFFVPLLYPGGRLPSPRWRWALWLAAIWVGIATVGAAFRPGVMEVPGQAEGEIENPVGIPAAASAIDALDVAQTALFFICLALSVAALVVRFRRSRGDERHQLKWFVYTAGLMLACFLVAVTANAAENSLAADTAGWFYTIAVGGWFGALGLLILGLPVATGIAIFKYRLYSIDVVINRTLVYGALTATLALAYLGSVLLLQLLLRPLTEESDLAIAGSTLAVAALFRPARSRIQALVDRRFYRSKYDATQILEGFGARLREEVELDTLSAELASVVRETMQPAHVSLWLRDAR